MSAIGTAKFVVREDKVFEQIVYAEVLVPNTLNTFNDYMTAETVKDVAYEFARHGYGIDIGHDQVDVNGSKCYVVESFIARDNDPDFIPGSWVVGLKITDPTTWQQVLDGELNGFSYEADILYHDATFTSPGVRTIIGVTEPDLLDGHTHTYVVVVGENNQVQSGGTGITDGHYHVIKRHTSTEEADGHKHRYQVVEE